MKRFMFKYIYPYSHMQNLYRLRTATTVTWISIWFLTFRPTRSCLIAHSNKFVLKASNYWKEKNLSALILVPCLNLALSTLASVCSFILVVLMNGNLSVGLSTHSKWHSARECTSGFHYYGGRVSQNVSSLLTPRICYYNTRKQGAPGDFNHIATISVRDHYLIRSL